MLDSITRRRVFIIISFIVLLLLIYYVYSYSLSIGKDSNNTTPHGELFNITTHTNIDLINELNNASFTLKNMVINGSRCGFNEAKTLSRDDVMFIYLCILDSLRINSSTEESISGNTSFSMKYYPVGVAINESGTYTTSFYHDGLKKIYSKVFVFETSIPKGYDQSLVEAYESGGVKYFVFTNTPFIYVDLRYIDGLGNATFIFKITFNINDKNITEPYVIRYSANSDFKTFFTLLENPVSESTLMEHLDSIKPLLEIRGGENIVLKIYVEIYVESHGLYDVEIRIGYPGIRVYKP